MMLIQEALDYLESQGEIKKQTVPGGKVMYRKIVVH
jgi:hypothetical protein